MKFILYISICSLLTTIKGQGTDVFDLLLDSINKASSDDIESSEKDFYKIKKPVIIPLYNFSFADANIAYPFVVKVTFKLEEFRTSSFFYISDESGKIKLGLSLVPASSSMIRVYLESDNFPDNKLIFKVTPVHKNVNTTILVHVTKDQTSASLDCVELNPGPMMFKKEPEEIKFNKKHTLHLGYSSETKQVFMGSIKEIKIYTNVQEPAYVHDSSICSGETSFPDIISAGASSDYDSPGEFDDNPHAEFLRFGDYTSADIPPSDIIGYEEPKKCIKGDKGDPGDYVRGPEGPQGIPGAQGAPGERGPKGNIGTCECSEGTISSLLRRMPEMRGPKGETGLPGEIGGPGPAGLTGVPGHHGETGPQGDKGETGEKGEAGRDGALGPKGEPGKDGSSGAPGLQGPQGPPGPPGPVTKEIEGTKEVAKPGEKGDLGPIGPLGIQGPIGPRGEKGQKGEDGIKGHKGDQGLKGENGLRGEKGERGSDGENGIPGNPGPHGRPGERGPKGDMGETGTPGSDGMPAKWTSLLDGTMNAEEREEIADLLQGEKGQKGNQGEKGDIGDQGLIGPPGIDGKDGRNGVPGEQGLTGPKGDIGPIGPRGHKGATGEPGPPSKAPGAAITLKKGPKGERGHSGKQGPRGQTGPKGNSGARGPVGPAGPKGNTGPQGPMGHKGVEGKKGAQGEKGEKGDRPTAVDLAMLKGDKGDTGNEGPMGPVGPPGPPGAASNYTPIPGPPGPSGPPGPPGPPGLSITGPKGEPAAISNFLYYSHENLVDEDDFYEAATVVYKSTRALIKRTPITPLGTLAFVLQEKMLLLRVENGWQYVVMGSIMGTQPDTTTTATPTTPPVPVRAPYITTTLRPSTTVRPRIQRFTSNALRLVALNDPYTGRMLSPTNSSGFFAVDNDCIRVSQKSGVHGSFHAFLHYDQESMEQIVQEQYRHLPVTNLFGDLLFDSWSSMFDGSGASLSPSANIYGFNRKNIFIDPTWPEPKVWHGTNSLDVRQKANCNDWRTDSPQHHGAASSLKSSRLLGQELYPCDSKFIVLCIEVSPISPRPQRHKGIRKRRKTPYRKRV